MKKNLTNHIKKLSVITTLALLSVPAIFIFLFREQSFELNENIATSLRERSKVTLAYINGELFELEIASTNDEITKGLMNRTFLSPRAGMIFVFPDEQVRTFWMKNTYIPLDIIFLDKELRVINFFKNAKPLDTNVLYTSTAPAKYVIELKGGSIDQINLSPNDEIKLL